MTKRPKMVDGRVSAAHRFVLEAPARRARQLRSDAVWKKWNEAIEAVCRVSDDELAALNSVDAALALLEKQVKDSLHGTQPVI
jgi:isoaspartyl peptidase/L-asparaginase-like protein (Ntn-hydrolase superfamily)